MASSAIDIKFKGWKHSNCRILGENQYFYFKEPYSLEKIVSNGKRNILVVSAHQDDEIIGMGGTICLLSDGVHFPPYSTSDKMFLEWYQKNKKREYMGGLTVYSKEEIKDIQKSFAKNGINLNLLYEEPSNVIVVYVTNGAKSEEAIVRDIERAHMPIEQFLEQNEFKSAKELTKFFNDIRYIEALTALNHVGGVAAIFLEYMENPDDSIKSDAPDDLAAIMHLIKPAAVYTLSPFEKKHNTHRIVSNATLKAARIMGNISLLKGYPVWNLMDLELQELVDISSSYLRKREAVHVHSLFGSQGPNGIGRRYEVIISINMYYAAQLEKKSRTDTDCFNAYMQRPNLPKAMGLAEKFFDMSSLLKNNQTLRDFVCKQVNKTYLGDFPEW